VKKNEDTQEDGSADITVEKLTAGRKYEVQQQFQVLSCAFESSEASEVICPSCCVLISTSG